MPEMIGRSEAKTQGLRYYFTGKPCKNGHISNRYAKSGHCVECIKKTSRDSHYNNHEYRLRYKEERRRLNPTAAREYYDENRERLLEQSKRWQRENRDIANHNKAKRRAATRSRSLELSVEHVDELRHIYQQASLLRYLGYDYHVDHVVPLSGEYVSGLHVPWNLQIIPAYENHSKYNKFDPYVEVHADIKEV